MMGVATAMPCLLGISLATNYFMIFTAIFEVGSILIISGRNKVGLILENAHISTVLKEQEFISSLSDSKVCALYTISIVSQRVMRLEAPS